MAYTGSIDLISGIRPKNNGTFPLVNAVDVYVDDNTRLPEALERAADAAKPATGTTAYWQAQDQSHFVPALGQIVVWTDHGTVTPAGSETPINVPGIKIGDGTTYNIDLPFVGDDVAAQLTALISLQQTALADHVNNQIVHITAAERAKWNNKITTSDTVSGDTLVLTRN